ncbi:hypothetical protein D3C86_1303940 [compost metagenome]
MCKDAAHAGALGERALFAAFGACRIHIGLREGGGNCRRTGGGCCGLMTARLVGGNARHRCSFVVGVGSGGRPDREGPAALGGQFGNQLVCGGDAVGQARGHGSDAGIAGGLRLAHSRRFHAAVARDRIHEHRVEPVNLGLPGAADVSRQRLVGVAIDLVRTSEDVRHGDAVLIERAREVDVPRDHTHGAGIAGCGNRHFVGCAGAQIGGRQRHAVSDGLHGLATTQIEHALRIFECALRLTARAVVDLKDRVNVGMAHRILEVGGQIVVAHEESALCHIEAAAMQQCAVDVEHRDAFDHAIAAVALLAAPRREQLGCQLGQAIGRGDHQRHGAEQAVAQTGNDGVELLRMDEQRRVEDPRCEMGVFHAAVSSFCPWDAPGCSSSSDLPCPAEARATAMGCAVLRPRSAAMRNSMAR